MNLQISSILIKLDKLANTSMSKEWLKKLMPTFAKNQMKWISEALVFLNYSIFYQIYQKEGGEELIKVLPNIQDQYI
jgi:hypothetical protein